MSAILAIFEKNFGLEIYHIIWVRSESVAEPNEGMKGVVV